MLSGTGKLGFAMKNEYLIVAGMPYEQEGAYVDEIEGDEALLDAFDPRAKSYLDPETHPGLSVYALHGSEAPLATNVKELRELAAKRPGPGTSAEFEEQTPTFRI